MLSAGGEAVAWRDGDSTEAHALGGVMQLRRTGRAGDREVEAGLTWTSTVRRASLAAAHPFALGLVTLRPYGRLGWGRRLPLQYTFALGGNDGFPGLHIGEVRGDREVALGARITYLIRGALLLLVEGATGRAEQQGISAGWVFGGRAGLGAETPIGPVRFEYGRTTRGDAALVVRLGRWF